MPVSVPEYDGVIDITQLQGLTDRELHCDPRPELGPSVEWRMRTRFNADTAPFEKTLGNKSVLEAARLSSQSSAPKGSILSEIRSRLTQLDDVYEKYTARMDVARRMPYYVDNYLWREIVYAWTAFGETFDEERSELTDLEKSIKDKIAAAEKPRGWRDLLHLGLSRRHRGDSTQGE